MSVCCLPVSDITLFWCLFPSFICRNHPFLLQRFWQTIRGYTRREWLRRCLKAQPIWTLFPTVPFLNHLMSTANAPYLAYTCPHFCLVPSISLSPSLFIFLYSARLYFKGWWGNCVSNPIEVKFAQSKRQSLRKKVICGRANDQVCVWSGWWEHSKVMQKPPVEENPQIKGCICLIFAKFKRMFKKIIKWCNLYVILGSFLFYLGIKIRTAPTKTVF